jgi:hypothetical protein
MNYYGLSFEGLPLTYSVQSEHDFREFVRFVQRNVSAVVFDNTVLLQRPYKIEKLKDKPKNIYDDWIF